MRTPISQNIRKYCGLLCLCLLQLSSIAGEEHESYSLQWVRNAGQWKGDFLYRTALHGGWLYLHSDGYTLKLSDLDSRTQIKEMLHHKQFNLDTQFEVQRHALRFQWLNTSGTSNVQEYAYPFYHNYFLGSDPKKWKSRVSVSYELKLKNLYEGVDWFLSQESLNPKHELIIEPYRFSDSISFEFLGVQESWIAEQGSLMLLTSLGLIAEQAPVAWQWIENKKVLRDCKFVYQGTGHQYAYEVADYDPQYTLVIDPVLVFSTYSGSVGDNFGFTATYDSVGCLYSGGIVDGNDGDFPATLGAFQEQYGGSTGGQAPIFLACDMAISKYAPDGTSLLYATYLGGSVNEHPHSLVVDNQNQLIVFGTTNSPDFPVHEQGFDTSHNGLYDMVLTKFSEDGSLLIGGTYLGGSHNDGINNGILRFNYADDFRGDVFVDSSDAIYIASCTRSFDFPVSDAAYQQTKGAGNDAVIVKLDRSLEQVIWATYWGGNAEDAAYSAKIIGPYLYVGGGTASLDMSSNLLGYLTSYQGGVADGFVAAFSADSGNLNHFTYYGTQAYDQVFFLDYDTEGQIYISGQTRGVIPRSPQTYGQDNTGQFIARLNPSLTQVDVQTTFGVRTAQNKPDLSPSAFLVDQCNNVYFSGWGANVEASNGSTKDLPITPNALQSTTDENDFYLIVLSPNFESLLYATYFGGSQSDDHVDGGTSRFDKSGVIYQSVCASCPGPSQSFLNDFPVTAQAVFPQNISRRCSNAAFKIDFRITYILSADFITDPDSGCSPLSVQFTNLSNGGSNYFWDFGDGNIDTARNPVHVFAEPGDYTIMLAVLDSLSCNKRDTVWKTLVVKKGVEIDFTYEKEACELKVDFSSQSQQPGRKLHWDFGDGMISSEPNPSHVFPAGGDYTVRLWVIDSLEHCKDSLEKTLTFPEFPVTDLRIPNVFTPNQDGYNDCYRVPGISEECEQGTLYIYNRWGIRVYQGDLVSECWNGRVNNSGEPLPSGTYIYQIVTEKERQSKRNIHGIIQLIRE